jgi:hypothetical protein
MANRQFVVCTALAMAAALCPLGSVAASAAPPANGCPAGYDLMVVATLTAAGYHVPALVDSPAARSFGQPGNGDGLICAVKLGNRLTPWGDSVYNFVDNQLPASP